MVISHKHRFIFIKTSKTAGTSIEVFLSQVCGPDDILTPFGREEPGHEPRNHEGFFNHITAAEVRAAVGEDTWNGYRTFCVERNPWDKTLSHYHFVNGRFEDGRLGFDAFLERNDLPINHPKYCEDGAIIVDDVLRYERLNEQLGALMQQLGVSWPGALQPRAKGHFRSDRRPYQEVYTEQQAALVATRFAEEIALFDYRFGET